MASFSGTNIHQSKHCQNNMQIISHLYGTKTRLPQSGDSRDGFHHGQAHHDWAGGVVLPVVRQATDTVVAIP